jgi:threonine aldolase
MIIDLRSDTITRPTRHMQEAMWGAHVGDDVMQEDPSVNELERKAAKMFGKEAALFVASGTMANQLAIKIHTVPGREVICDRQSHVYLYEGGGIMSNALASVKLLDGDFGCLAPQQIAEAIADDSDIHTTPTRMVSLENTMNKGGGVYYKKSELEQIQRICVDRKVALHLDGARLFNALVETREAPIEYGQIFDTLAVCLSKGLGCPVGSLLLGSKKDIQLARRYRKALGGGWRQAGYLAAAGSYALDHHIVRLREDHQRAKAIRGVLETLPEIDEIYPSPTNIVIARLSAEIDDKEYVQRLSEKGILAIGFGKSLVRFVTHLDFTDDHLETFQRKVRGGII